MSSFSNILIYRGIEYQTVDIYKGFSIGIASDFRNSYPQNDENINWNLCFQNTFEIRNGKVYFISANYLDKPVNEIFNTTQPILANWLTTEAVIKISDNLQEDFFNSTQHNEAILEYFVEFKIINGNVISKTIFAESNNDILLNFGKYKGRTFGSILNGIVKHEVLPYWDNNKIIENYISAIVLFLTDENFKYKIQVPKFPFDAKLKNEIKYLIGKKFNIIVNHNYVLIKCIEEEDDIKFAEMAISFIELILNSEFFTSYVVLNRTYNTNNEINPETLFNSDYKYINWLLLNVDTFCVSPSILNKGISCNSILKFNTNRVDSTLLTFEPIYKSIDTSFSDKIKKINQNKFEDFNKVLYNEENDRFYLNRDEKDIMEEFGYFLDENYFPSNIEENNNYELNDSDYYYNSNNWLRDAAGTDDEETMNDVFWNLD